MIGRITVNQLILWKYSLDEEAIERILWIDEGNIITYAININKEKGMPFKRTVSEIEDALNSEKAFILKDDPLIHIVTDDVISEKAKQIRDKAWDIINPLVAVENEPYIYNRNIRGTLVKEFSQKFSVTEKTIYKYLRRYWQRGKIKNALLPDYYNSGGRGKEKTVGDKKLGRPRKYKDKLGQGININEDTKRVFRVAVARYYHTSKENSLSHAYKMMLKDFFSETIFDNGMEKTILRPQNEIPTLTQFKYWYEKEYNIKEKLRSRKGMKKYLLEDRAVLGSSSSGVAGPGSVYQIDATIADIYLVSRYNRQWIVGRPVIYVLIDVFSRMITGVYVGLEGPSWLGAMMALNNATADKVKLCKEYNVEITEEDWPCQHVPETIMADRGELLGKSAESLVEALNIRLQFAPPYRADWKGIVEQHFKIFHGKVKPFVPGFIDKDFRERGAKDYRLDANLDIYQFTQIVIYCVLHHNKRRLSSYVRDEMMISHDIDSIPKDIWNWGIINRSGRLRTFSEDVIKLSLMPKANARVTGRGIIFKGLAYTCTRAIQEVWFEKARKKSWTLEISYDPRNMNNVYLWDSQTRNIDICQLLDSHSRYLDKTLDEIKYLIEYENLSKNKKHHSNLQDDCNLASHIEAIVEEAKAMGDGIMKTSKTSNAKKIKGININRNVEKNKIRKEEAFILEEGYAIKPQIAEHNNSTKPEKMSRLDLLKRKQMERKTNG